MTPMSRAGTWVFRAYFVAVILFLFFPLFIVVPMSFNDARFMGFPPEAFSLRWYESFFENQVWIEATLLSFRVSLAATAIAAVIGTLASLALVRGRFLGKTALYALMLAPMIVPPVIIALGIFIMYSKLGLIDSEIGLIAAHVVIALPFVVLVVSATLQQYDVTIERAARVLGAGPIKAFVLITLPAIAPAIIAASLFAFFVSFDELIIALFIMGGSETLPMRIWSDLRLEFNPTVSAVATLLIAVTTVGMTLAEALRRRATARLATPESSLADRA